MITYLVMQLFASFFLLFLSKLIDFFLFVLFFLTSIPPFSAGTLFWGCTSVHWIRVSSISEIKLYNYCICFSSILYSVGCFVVCNLLGLGTLKPVWQPSCGPCFSPVTFCLVMKVFSPMTFAPIKVRASRTVFSVAFFASS